MQPSQFRLPRAAIKLQKAEEDRAIAWQLITRLLVSVDENTDDVEDVGDKCEALTHALKRLEESSRKVEIRQNEMGVSIEERLNTMETHEKQVVRIKSKLRNLLRKPESNGPSDARRDYHYTGIRLPKMELKPFDGDVMKWHEFWVCFEHGVHANPSLPDHQKLQYLKNCLRGPAFVTISDIQRSGDQYEAAIRLLKDRYGHRSTLRKAHLDGIERLPAISNSYELYRLKRFHEEVECHVKALTAIGVSQMEYSMTMVPKVLGKLPFEIRMRLTENQDEDDDLTMMQLIEGLRRCVRVMEKCGVAAKTSTSQPQPKKPLERPSIPSQAEPRAWQATGATLTSVQHQKKETCEFCLDEHKASDCSKYTTVKEREAVIKRYKRWYRCLKRGHVLSKCNKAETCSKCAKSKHHETLCNGIKEPTGVLNSKTMNPTAAIAYRTLIARVHTASGEGTTKCRVLLDSGSAKSFATQKLITRLESKPVSKMNQTLEGFNGSLQELKTEIHELQLSSLDGNYSIPVEVKTIPAATTIGSPAPLKLKERYAHFKDVYLTDVTKECNLEVDMLLGSQHLAEMLTGQIHEGGWGEPVAVHTDGTNRTKRSEGRRGAGPPGNRTKCFNQQGCFKTVGSRDIGNKRRRPCAHGV
eukprot:gene3854-biopygen3283